ncbi:porphobilinogen synthase [Pseudogracilibacillus sp. ICA-222130]|uniref:porphobilinogen synthase n=1 Tax=Pseudogracilibacillus sp. ICA-222130 TaxID=3134655 RepID=UPI0030BD2E87
MENASFKRHRRLRHSEAMREMVRETTLSVNDFIYPLFITEESNTKKEVPSMPGVYQISLDFLEEELDELQHVGLKAVLLFGIPKEKDEEGTGAYDKEGIVQRATRLIKQYAPNMLVIADTCLCEYTSHGHCGVLRDGYVENDSSLQLLAKTAVTQAEAGADIIAPSNMMDGFVTVIRNALDEAGFVHIPIMSYAVKYASAFYGPFRDAAESTPAFGDRKTYQMDIANRKEALREAKTDTKEGGDFIIVKPALAYLDIVREVYNHVDVPVVAYNVSGEYSMTKAAALNGWIDEKSVVMEKLIAMKRAGAQLIVTYYAKEVARWLKNTQ